VSGIPTGYALGEVYTTGAATGVAFGKLLDRVPKRYRESDGANEYPTRTPISRGRLMRLLVN
jgi:hypothetical protein